MFGTQSWWRHSGTPEGLHRGSQRGRYEGWLKVGVTDLTRTRSPAVVCGPYGDGDSRQILETWKVPGRPLRDLFVKDQGLG